jgi:aconitase A
MDDGTPVYLTDPWPTREDIDALVLKANDPADFRRDFFIASLDPQWRRVEAPDGAQYPWDPASTILRRPPFAAMTEGSLLGQYAAHPLLVLGDVITTDHISPASAIPPTSNVADFLVAKGEDRADLNVFASRRGNWEVMVRGAFHAKSLRTSFGLKRLSRRRSTSLRAKRCPSGTPPNGTAKMANPWSWWRGSATAWDRPATGRPKPNGSSASGQ